MLCRIGWLVFLSCFLPLSVAHAQKITKHQTPEEQIKHFQVPDQFRVELVAADPLVINPIAMTLDENGWLYVSESHTYRYGPSGSPIKPFSNPIVCLKPTADGKGYERVMCVEGFEEPVMGMTIRDGKLWCTANNYLFQFDLDNNGKASNKKTILIDKNKAWNPFGMFVLEQGPDGLFYLSVGNHNIDIGGPTNRVSGRGSSGIVLRMKPDGSDMERLVHGLRVPYSFEYDPFGQLWVLSNGEGNPNRFLRVIDGVDYHCYSRGVDNNWLAGRHELAPPCFELPSGAHTQLMRYYGAAYPASYQGSLLLDNWGAHGFNGANRAIFRYVPDDKGNITTKEMFVGCKDPHFRPSYITLDPDGNLLIADWYGRDDESDRTGRIWRIRYTGSDAPKVTHKLDGDEWKKDEYVLDALGSAQHLVREKAVRKAVSRGVTLVPALGKHAASAKEPMGAANALWVLSRINTPDAHLAITSGTDHSDWRVRRLALNLLRRHDSLGRDKAAEKLRNDDEAAVRIEAGLAYTDPSQMRATLIGALKAGAAKDAHLRYEAAWHLAKHADEAVFAELLGSKDPQVRLAGLIALDVACFENFTSKTTALKSLANSISNFKESPESEHLLTLANLNSEKAILIALEKLALRTDVAPSTTARALLVLRAKAGTLGESVLRGAGKRFLEAVEKGSIKVSSSTDQLLLLELLEGEGPTPFAIKQTGNYLNAGGPVRSAAHALVRKFGEKASPLAASLWPRALDSKTKLEDRLEMVSTLARIDTSSNHDKWQKLLADSESAVVLETVRWWRVFKDQGQMKEALIKKAPLLVKNDASLKGELSIVLRQVAASPDALKSLGFSEIDHDKKSLTEEALSTLSKLSNPERQKRTLLGRHVFDRAGCVKCHTTLTQNTPLAPSLKGIATSQKAEYLVESILFPSKVIKTGYETELVLTTDGRSLIGLVKEEGADLRILTAEKEIRVAKTEVEERRTQKLSLMPQDQEKTLSQQEFIDLIAYLQTLK